MTIQVALSPFDPVVFAQCSGQCCVRIPGKEDSNYFAKAYTRRDWAAGPVCDNCSSPMTKLYEIRTPKVRKTR